MDQTNEQTYNMDKVRAAAEYLQRLTFTDKQSQKRQIEFIRQLANIARTNTTAHDIIENKLDFVERFLPYESKTFRCFFLDGEKRKTARMVGRELCMDYTTVFRHIKKVLEYMLVLIFGSSAILEEQKAQARHDP